MTQIDDLKSKIGLLPKTYKKENLAPIRESLEQISLDESNVETVYRLLDPIQSPDLSKMLNERWEALPHPVRTCLIRLRRSGKDRDRVISGCISLAAGLAVKDASACADLLSEAFSQSKGSDVAGKFLLTVLRRDWLSGPIPLPFEALAWNQLSGSWRWQFLYALVNVIQGDDTKRIKLSDEARQSLISWLSSLSKMQGLPVEDASKLSALVSRLDPSQKPFQPGTPAQPGQIGTSTATILNLTAAPAAVPIKQSPPLEEAAVQPQPTQRSSSQPPAVQAVEVSAAIDRLLEVWHRFSKFIDRPPSLDPITKRIREMEQQLRDANVELENESATNQQLRRNLQAVEADAERTKVERASLLAQLTETQRRLAAIEPLVDNQKVQLEIHEQEMQNLRKQLTDQEAGYTRHVQEHLKEERRACRVEIGQAIQNKVRQIQSLKEKSATSDLVEIYRSAIGGLLDGLLSQGITIER